MTRVQIPVYTDHWMRGDRYGDLIKITKPRQRRLIDAAEQKYWNEREIAHVKLDKSGKTIRVILQDCTVY